MGFLRLLRIIFLNRFSGRFRLIFIIFLNRLFFIIIDSNRNRPEYVFVEPADGCTEDPDDFLGIKVGDIPEMFAFQVLSRLKAASGKDGIGDACSGGQPELHAGVLFLQPFKGAA